MKNLAIVALSSFVFLVSCSKENKTFTLKTLKLNAFEKSVYKSQNLRLKMVAHYKDGTDTLATTDVYPSTLPMPATFNLVTAVPLKLYEQNYEVELWGDSTGWIGSATINMKDYKIIFPLEMEANSPQASFSLIGSWK